MRPAFAALFVVLAFAANAQILPSALTGRVTAGDAPAAGVTVTATSRARQVTRTATTGAQGTYWIDVLEPGEYDVSFSRAGLTSLSRPAIVELGRIARADARLEASDDEETVTSTARTVSVAEWTSMTTHFTGEELDRMPVPRDLTGAALLATGFIRGPGAVLDHTLFYPQNIFGEEVLDEATVFRADLPIEGERFLAGTVAGRTRSGADDFFLALRDSISSERWFSDRTSTSRDTALEHLFESASGGRIGRTPLWFFAAGWSGDAPERDIDDMSGFALKLDGQLGNAHQLTALHIDSEAEYFGFDPGASITSLRYTGALNERLTAGAFASHGESALFGFTQEETLVSTRLSYVLPSSTGDHVLAGGVSRYEPSNQWSVFLGDRWSAGRWFVDAGLRYQDGTFGPELTPRVAVTFDLRGNGRHALIASYGEYASVDFDSEPSVIGALGYAIAIGSSGSVRADFLRRDYPESRLDQIQLDARYRLFDRLDLGASYTWTDADIRGNAPFWVEQVANAWAGIELPIGEHEFGATFLQRFYTYDEFGDQAPSDLALRYSLPIRRTVFTIAADVQNLFDVESGVDSGARTARLWLRLGFGR